ncbi:hypothetical protein NGTWS1803_20180 [Mycolicibacterium cyprinidarum]|nr:hypothetical protein NGTWS1803_20180 [Mycolicibacterium sp. NGTWS1803]
MDTTAFENYESEVRAYSRAFPTVFASASNARILDEDGRSFIDFFAGAGVLNFGHNDPRMKQAMIEFLQADGIAHSLDLSTTTKRDFLTRFHDVILAPRGMNHRMQFTGPTGTNAVEAALKLARLVTGRREVVAFQPRLPRHDAGLVGRHRERRLPSLGRRATARRGSAAVRDRARR